MAMAVRVLRGVLALLPIPVWACSCAVGPVQYCGQAPDLSNQQKAVFVGVVRDFYPKSHEQMNQLLDEFYRSHPDLRPSPGNRAGRVIAGAPQDDQEFRREFIRSLWGNSLSAMEQDQLRNADRQELDRLMLDYRRRAHLQILENFSNAEGLEFEVFTNLDGPSCGFDFIEGETYLVEAYRNDSTQRWQVSSCLAPKLVSASPFEVSALRAWKAGQQPKVRIFGDVFSPTGQQSPAGLKLQLLGGDRPLETVSDSRGGFEFQNLAAKNYQLVWSDAVPRVRAVDMTHAWCARIIVPR
jgi:hypothetical protein